MTDTTAIQERIGELCHQFRLPTLGAQLVASFTTTDHGPALETFLDELAAGRFVDHGVNELAFGLARHRQDSPGRRGPPAGGVGRSVLFAPAYRLVQDLLVGKLDLALLATTKATSRQK